MTFPVLLTLCLAVITLLTFLLLIGRAFSRSTTWGLLVMLFSPVSALAYGVRFGRDERVVLAAYLGSLAVTAAVALYLFTSWGGWDLLQSRQQVEQALAEDRLQPQDVERLRSLTRAFEEHARLYFGSSRLLSRAEQALTQQELAQQAEAEAAATAATAAIEDKPLDLKGMTRKARPEKERFRLTYVTIDLQDAPSYVGSTVKVTRRNVVEKEYRLVSASGSRLELAQRTGSGSYTFRYRNSDIEKIRVLTKQPY